MLVCLNRFFILMLLVWAGARVDGQERLRYRLGVGSALYLKGNTNVHEFSCWCQESFTPDEMEWVRLGRVYFCRGAELSLRVRQFGCNNRKIDLDLQRAMQADTYPWIRVTLVSVDAGGITGGEGLVHAEVDLTLTQVTHRERVAVHVRNLGDHRFSFKGKKEIQMSRYGITPPQALFGMIQVQDWIAFHFDIVIQVDEASK